MTPAENLPHLFLLSSQSPLFGGPTLQVYLSSPGLKKNIPGIPHHSLACWEWWGEADSVTGTLRQGMVEWWWWGVFLECRGPVLVKLLIGALCFLYACVCVFLLGT